MTPLQKATAQAIVNVFETGTVTGDYGNITLMAGDTGHLTYGRSQTTLSSGNLAKLVDAYAAAPNAQFGARLKEYLPRVRACDLSLDNDTRFRRLLRLAGQSDPVMRDVQDAFFDKVYWQPAVNAAALIGTESALGMAIVYDSAVHGSWGRIRLRTNASVGTRGSAGERVWFSEYVKQRRYWLANHSNDLLHLTVYRMDSFRAMINAGNWKLDLPVVAHGVTITAAKMGL